jgi:DNA ligase-1
MKRFTALYQAIDATTSTTKKVAAMVAYFGDAPAHDAAWAAYFLAGGKPRQVVPTMLLRELACAQAGIAPWLFDESYAVTGDLAEAIAYVLPAPRHADDRGLAAWMEQTILPLRGLDRDTQVRTVTRAWERLDADERFIFVKLIGGGFRVGVSKLLVQRALAQYGGLDAKLVAQRMMGWTDAKQPPTVERFQSLIAPPEADAVRVDGAARTDGRPYPFFLAHALDVGPAMLGPVDDWMVEWKYDGIRAQLVRRGGGCWVWTRGEELVTERYPELRAMALTLPDGTVIDGEILVWREGDDRPSSFALLQKRIGRLTVTKKLLAEAPVRFVAYDILEHEGVDQRLRSQRARRALLEAVCDGTPVRLSPLVTAPDWATFADLRSRSRDRGVEGFMLKHHESRYGTGRTKADGTWWKWKIDPHTVDAVLVYAQAGHGRRANVYTDYTFAVWNRTPLDDAEVQAVLDAIRRREPARDGALQLVPFAKAYSGLSDEAFAAVDRTIRRTTTDTFGPVRGVVPSLVFELAFEGIQRSTRHKSGVATRFPRMLRLREDKPLREADTLASLLALIDRG